jgi:hypothetical protein
VLLSLTIILHVAVDEAQGAAPSDLSCFGVKAIAFVALEAVIAGGRPPVETCARVRVDRAKL